MQVLPTEIPGLLIIEPDVFSDQRGYFFESYNQKKYQENGIGATFVQDNISSSVRGVIRGLHYQLAPYAQAKLIQVLKGAVIDVAVDLREGSPTFGQHMAVEISEENKRQFYVPEGFAHGFAVISDEVLFSYKCDNYYNKEAERGISYNDPELKINWQISADDIIISPKDQALPSLKEAERNFAFEK